MSDNRELIVGNLKVIFTEIERQAGVGRSYPPGQMSFEDEMANLREWIFDVNEFGIAYENLVASLEAYPFRLSGQAAVKLLEVGLLLGFKTDRPEDSIFDRSKRMD